MRNGPSNHKVFRWYRHSSGQRKTTSRQLVSGIAFLVLSFVAFPLCAQASMQSLLKPLATPAPAQHAATPSPVPSPTPVQAIPLPEIANQAEDLDRLLSDISKTLVPVLDVRVTDSEEKEHAEAVRQRARQTEELLAGIPNLMQLQDEDQYWRALAEQYGSQRKLLTERAAGIEKQMQLLDAEQARWKATSEQVRETSGLKEVAERVQRELEAIQKLRSQAQDQLNLMLTLQNRISEQDRQVSSMLLRVTEAHQRLRGRLLERDSHPLWAIRELRAFDQSMSAVIYVSAGRGFTGSSNFLRTNRALLFGLLLVYVVVLLAALGFKRYVTNGANPVVGEEALRVFVRPYSVALLIALLTTIGITTSAPTGVSFVVVCLIYLVPVLRLLPTLIKPGMRNILYVLCFFYVLDWFHLVLQFGAVFKRELFAIIILFALLIFAWLARPSCLKLQPTSGWRHRLLVVGIRVGILLLAISLCANVLGFVSLSQVLGVGTLFSGFIFALLYTLVRVLDLALAIVLGSKWFQSLPDVRGDVVERWGRRILISGASLLWLNNNLYLFTVRDTVMQGMKSVLEYPVGFGKVHITLGGTLSLVFFLLLGYAIANIAKFMLEDVFLPKLSLRGGLGYAISRVTYYLLLVGIFFAALSDAGVELNKFTMITGAVGLGVGFGLQNIVNNFASGLILLFERPFRIGDTVEVGGVVGTVKRIGARSSTVLTFQYAEVILPNSNLLSNQVINWTLTSARRRVEVPVGVAYGTDPELALKLLIEVAHANPRILKEPRPEAFFLGFGESALNLELRFWAAQSIWFELKSEVGLAVFRALRQAGIEIPYPQRDLHVRTIDSALQVESPGKEGISAVSDREAVRKISAGR
jgi:small-conductance mechanosensitive channel